MKGDDTGTRLRTFIIRSLALIFANLGCLFSLFGPKVYHILAGTEATSDVSGLRSSTAGRTWSSKRSPFRSSNRESTTSSAAGAASDLGRRTTTIKNNPTIKSKKKSEDSL